MQSLRSLPLSYRPRNTKSKRKGRQLLRATRKRAGLKPEFVLIRLVNGMWFGFEASGNPGSNEKNQSATLFCRSSLFGPVVFAL
jgi:hypothetical protein